MIPEGIFEGEVQGLFHLGEAAAGVVAGGRDGGEGDWFFAGEPADFVHGVDADVHERAAAAILTGEAPLVGGGVESKTALEGLDLADGARVDEALGFDVGGLVVDAVGDHELDIGFAAGVDHGAALGGGDGHGLLAEDVLAGLRGADGVLAMHAVGQTDVYGVDVFVVADAVEGFVGVDGGFGDAVHFGVVLALGIGMAGDEGGDFGGLGIGAGAHEDVGDGAETDGGVSDGLFCRIGSLCKGGQAGGGEREGREFGEGAAVQLIHAQQRMPEMIRLSN